MSVLERSLARMAILEQSMALHDKGNHRKVNVRGALSTTLHSLSNSELPEPTIGDTRLFGDNCAMYITYHLLAACATANFALAAPQQAKMLSDRSAIAVADAQNLNSKIGGTACPAWSYYRYVQDDCHVGPDAPTKPTKLGGGTRASACQSFNLPTFRDPLGLLYQSGGAWDLHIFSTTNCQKSPGTYEIVLEAGDDYGCVQDLLTASFFVALNKGAKCVPH